MLFYSIIGCFSVIHSCFANSYMSSYFTSYFGMPHDSLDIHIYVSKLVGDFIVVDRVYRSCAHTINGYDMIVNISLLNVVKFKVIFGMDYLSRIMLTWIVTL